MDRQTDTQMAVTTIQFASSTTHAKCNRWEVKTVRHPEVAEVTSCGMDVGAGVEELLAAGCSSTCLVWILLSFNSVNIHGTCKRLLNVHTQCGGQ